MEGVRGAECCGRPEFPTESGEEPAARRSLYSGGRHAAALHCPRREESAHEAFVPGERRLIRERGDLIEDDTAAPGIRSRLGPVEGEPRVKGAGS